MDYFFTIDKTAFAEFKDRGSRFIACAFPMQSPEDFKKILQQLKKEHPKAVHHCFGYRLGITGDIFRVSDDGEPSGTAGRPILGQIDNKNLTDTGIIVVRYFGGTLLGVPGLIHAYKTVSALVLQMVPVVQKHIEISYMLHFDYSLTNEIMKLVKQYNCTVLEQEIQLFPFIKLGIPMPRLEEVLSRLKDFRNVRVEKIV
jgi:uncharacterized YigZ family protein